MTDVGGARRTVAEVIGDLERIEAELAPDDARRHFHSVYLRTTRGVAEELRRGGFVDPDWLQELDVVFAGLYLDALAAWDRGDAPVAWRVPFTTARDRPELQPIRHVLFGINVHINYDLPQALLAVVTGQDFDDPAVVERRERDHEHINDVLSARVASEDRAIPGRTITDRLLAPLNHRASRRFLREARAKVWRNARVLSGARRDGPERLAQRVRELDGLCAARARDLVAPGQIVLKLARRGFGVLLEGA